MFRLHHIRLGLIFGLAIAFCSYTSPFASDSWELKKEEEGIRILTKKIDGSNFKAFRAEMTIPCQAEKVVSTICNANNGTQWLQSCKESSILQQEDKNTLFVYNLTCMPFPFEDRDMIFKLMTERKNGIIEIKMEGVPDFMDKKQGVTRVQHARGHWTIQKMDDASVRIVHEMHWDPGGNIPAWMVNFKTVDIPFTTFKKLRSLLSN